MNTNELIKNFFNPISDEKLQGINEYIPASEFARKDEEGHDKRIRKRYTRVENIERRKETLFCEAYSSRI